MWHHEVPINACVAPIRGVSVLKCSFGTVLGLKGPLYFEQFCLLHIIPRVNYFLCRTTELLNSAPYHITIVLFFIFLMRD